MKRPRLNGGVFLLFCNLLYLYIVLKVDKIDTVYGDYGLNNEAVLKKYSFIVDKETHIVEYGVEEYVKSIEIEGTAQDYPDEW